jgi:hypothetical protein
VLAANPLERGNRVKLTQYKRWWRLVQSTREHPAAAHLLGPAMYGLDRVAMRLGETPTAKLLLFKRP